MRIAIIQFPGSNCERETRLAVERAGMVPVDFLWNEDREKLTSADGYVIVGGFSYEDRSRAGIIAALDPVLLEIKAQSEQGKPVLGICNGAQILVEAGLVPGLENNKLAMALTDNQRIQHGKILGTGYYNAWVRMRLSDSYQRNAFTRCLDRTTILSVPVAHAEGRFVMTPALWQEIAMQGLNVFQYCDEEGRIVDAFPVNPNGSLGNTAAISNKAGNVMAIMPHPERTTQGDALFRSMREYILENRQESVLPLAYYPRHHSPLPYRSAALGQELIAELMITDNQALTVENTLNNLGIPVTVRRQTHWEMQCGSQDVIEKIKASGALYNERKEMILTRDAVQPPRSASFLVRPHDNLHGEREKQLLEDHFFIQGIQAIKKGTLWHFNAKQGNISDWIEPILKTSILFNPYAHDYYRYESFSS